MDQQYWEAEGMDDDFEPETHVETEAQPEIFFLALKLALTRLKEYSTVTTG